jgi:hypothetical protein
MLLILTEELYFCLVCPKHTLPKVPGFLQLLIREPEAHGPVAFLQQQLLAINAASLIPMLFRVRRIVVLCTSVLHLTKL